MTNHRKPPKPEHWRYVDWENWGVIETQQTLRKRLLERDGGKCAQCGKVCTENSAWQADHITPLENVDTGPLEYPKCLKYWSLSNAQTLCRVCHRKKSNEETTVRAKVIRLQNKWTKAKENELVTLYRHGLTINEIMEEMGYSRGCILGKLYRIKRKDDYRKAMAMKKKKGKGGKGC